MEQSPEYNILADDAIGNDRELEALLDELDELENKPVVTAADGGAICPLCFKPVERPNFLAIDPGGTARYLRHAVRRYFGWCSHCQEGFEVIQFAAGDKWHFHKYQLYEYDDAGRQEAKSDWVRVEPLPEPPVLQFGPGGDFAEPIGDDELRTELEAIAGALKGLYRQIKQTLKRFKHGRIS